MVGAWLHCDDTDRPLIAHNGKIIVSANEQVLKLFRATPEDMIGTPVRLWIHRPEWAMMNERIRVISRVDVDELPENNYTFVRLDGSLFYASLKPKKIAPELICCKLRMIADLYVE